MSIPYPNKPWTDGQSFEYTTVDGAEVIGTYSAAKNAWTFAKFNDEPPAIIDPNDIYTTDVKTVEIPFTSSPKNITGIDTQYDVNWYLADQVSQNKAQLQFLEQTVFGFSNISIGPLPPNNPDLFNFWYNPNENLVYYWDAENQVWVKL